jgi:hypothetical protein
MLPHPSRSCDFFFHRLMTGFQLIALTCLGHFRIGYDDTADIRQDTGQRNQEEGQSSYSPSSPAFWAFVLAVGQRMISTHLPLVPPNTDAVHTGTLPNSGRWPLLGSPQVRCRLMTTDKRTRSPIC